MAARSRSFSFKEFKNGISDLPRRYAVVLDFETAKNSNNGNAAFDDLKDDPLMIVRAGGAEAAAAYLDKARDRNKSAVMGSWHCLNDIDPDQPQTRVLFLGGNEGGAKQKSAAPVGQGTGLHRHLGHPLPDADRRRIRHSWRHRMINMARYVAVAPRNVSTSLRNLPFTN